MDCRILVIDVEPRIRRLARAESTVRVIELQADLGCPSRILRDVNNAVGVVEARDVAGTDIQGLLGDINKACDVLLADNVAVDPYFGGWQRQCPGTKSCAGCRQWQIRRQSRGRLEFLGIEEVRPCECRRWHLQDSIAGDLDRKAIDKGGATPLSFWQTGAIVAAHCCALNEADRRKPMDIAQRR